MMAFTWPTKSPFWLSRFRNSAIQPKIRNDEYETDTKYPDRRRQCVDGTVPVWMQRTGAHDRPATGRHQRANRPIDDTNHNNDYGTGTHQQPAGHFVGHHVEHRRRFVTAAGECIAVFHE